MPFLALVLQSIFGILVLLSPFLTGGMWQAATPLLYLGLLLTAAGVVLTLWSCLNLGTRFTIFAQPRAAGLKTDGLYRYSRNPIYSGILLAGLGWAIAHLNPFALLANVILMGVLRWKISYEEKFLLEKYPQEYQHYCNEVGRFSPWF